MTRQAYPTDLNDTQWALIAPLLPKRQSTRGAPRTWTDRDILDAISYIVRGGCGWRLMPHDLPPWQTVYGYYWRWRNSGLWEQINSVLVQKVRVQQGREPQPSAGIIDSQSVKTSEGGEERGVDVYKQVAGRKPHIMVDTLGLLLLVLVHRASIPDGNSRVFKRKMGEILRSPNRLTIYSIFFKVLKHVIKFTDKFVGTLRSK